MMASSHVPLNDLGRGCTIVTQVVPSTTVSALAEQNLSQIQSPLKKFLKGEPKVLGVRATLVLNIFGTVAAGIAVIILYMDLLFGPMYNNCHYYDYSYECRYASRSNGISGVLLVFSLLQFAVSIAVSAFTCKATCTDQPTLNIINVVQNPASGVPVVISNPPYQGQPGVSTINDMVRSSSPVYYDDIDGIRDNSKLEG